MRVIPVADHHQTDLNDYFRLTDVALRRSVETPAGLYLAESTKVIERALTAGHRPRSVLSRPEWLPQLAPLLADHPDTPVYVAAGSVLELITGFHLHRGALAAMHRPALAKAETLLTGARLVVIVEDLVDHTNVGAIFRAAAGLGADAVLVTSRCADPLYRRSVRVSMGTVLQVPWTRLPPWPSAVPLLRSFGFILAGLALNPAAVPLERYAADRPEHLAVVFGTEGDGLSAEALRAVDDLVTIPMFGGVDSLNVAAAAAVTLWALRTPAGSG